MRVRLFRNDDGSFDVLCEPRGDLGLARVYTQRVDKKELANVVRPTAETEQARKEALKGVKFGSQMP